MVDLHSGGSSLWYPPTLLRGQGADQTEAARLRLLQDAFDLPYAWVFTGGGGRGSTARTAMGAANRNGVTCVMAELGGGGVIDRDILALTLRGLRRVLHALGHASGPHARFRPMARESFTPRGRSMPGMQGCSNLSWRSAKRCFPGQSLGLVHDRDHPDRAPSDVISPFGAGDLAGETGHGSRGDRPTRCSGRSRATPDAP